MPQDVKSCPSRRVSPDSTEDALVFGCEHPNAQEVEFHVAIFRGKEELASNMMKCPQGYSIETLA